MTIRIDDDGHPVLKAYHVRESDGVHLAIWCPKCKSRHLHGAGGGGGHRVAHCADHTHFPRGYVLEIAGSVDRYKDVNKSIRQVAG